MAFPLTNMSTVPGKGTKTNDLLQTQIHNRRANDRAIIENPLGR
jgi:hypothetical protein